MEDHENDMLMQEWNELEDIFLRQTPILKHNLPVEPLGIFSQPKEDPVFDLKPLPDTLKYAYLDEKKVYPVIINSNLSGYEEERLLETLRRHRGPLAILLMISRVLVHPFANILSISSPMLNLLLIINDG